MTRKVHLLTTGKCERTALHLSLARLFVDVDVEFVPVDGLTNSFTSERVIEPPQIGVRNTAEKFATELVGVVEESGPDDLVIGVDDLELTNLDQPEMVFRLLRTSVQTTLGRYTGSGSKQARLEAALRERCSFHLLSPMVEACFFKEPAALQRAKATNAPSQFDSATDAEAFAVSDANFLAASDATDANKERRKRSWRKPNRANHPKHYVKYLCDPSDEGTVAWTSSGTTPIKYREAHEGKAALEQLDWKMVLQHSNHMQFARALIVDLSDALGVSLPTAGETHPAASKPPQDRVLRNI